MILLAATVAMLTPPLSAADFFPLRPGTQMQYEEKSMMEGSTLDVVGTPVELAGQMVTPVVTKQGGKEVNTTYYRVSGSGVDIMAYSLDAPLPVPLPVLRVPEKNKITWKHEGPANADRMAEPLLMEGSSEFKGEREYLGKKRPILEVRIKARVGGSRMREEVSQVAIYAKDLGLVELTSVTKVAKREAKSVLKLVKVEEPKEEG